MATGAVRISRGSTGIPAKVISDATSARVRVVVLVANRRGMPSFRRVAMASGDPSMGSHDTVRTPSMSISRPSIATTTFALTSFGWPLP